MIAAQPVPDTLAARAGVLFEAYRSGEPARMADLVALLTPIMWHTVRAQNLGPDSAEDVIQSTWLTLVRHADSISDPQAVLQWLIVTARREAWRVSRIDRRAEPSDIEPDDIVTDPQAAPDETVLRDATDRQLWDHVARLPDRCRQLLRVIAFAERPDYAALAGALGMPVGSIGPTRGRCLAKLRAQLAADSRWES